MVAAKEAEPLVVSDEAKDLFNHHWQDEVLRMLADGHDLETFRSAGKPSKAWPKGENSEWWLAHGPEMVQRWINFRAALTWPLWREPLTGAPAIELELLATYGDVPLKMIIDRVFIGPAGLIVVDLKSGSRSPASDLQLGFYKVGLESIFKVKVAGGAYWMARTGQLSEIVSLNRFTPNLINAYAKRMVDGINAGVFIPHLTAMCRACGHADFCVAYGGRKRNLDSDYELTTNIPSAP